MKNIAIIMPSYNEGDRLISTLTQLFVSKWPLTLPFTMSHLHIVLIDDGSAESPAPSLGKLSIPPDTTLHLLRHQVNLGQGASLQTGITFARNLKNVDVFVTMDSDGQHSPEDLPILVSTLIGSELDVVFGNRFGTERVKGMPFARLVMLNAARIFEQVFTGIRSCDAHNGFRVFNRNCADKMNMRQPRMAHATEFKQIIARHKLRYGEASVNIHYSSETLAKGQRNSGSFLILKDLLNTYFFDRG